ncbi:AMP-binding protein [Ottowia sp.]|uniref:AMP-binding protein n=1 Tax=Ottowia sp. TaxID=1898956 RepID=UPI002D1FBDC3|nr:AMP-binding protein [Ottowia sp.]
MLQATCTGVKYLESAAVVGCVRDWTWRDVHAAADALASQFSDGSSVCNLCSTRVGFLIVWLAALRSGALMVLPPSAGPTELSRLLADSSDIVAVAEDESILRPVGDLGVRTLCYSPLLSGDASLDANVSFGVDWDRRAVCLFTSGSTGKPNPHWKTFQQLLQGAQVLAARLDPLINDGLAGCRGIVSSVAPQHMFGFESSVMLSLLTGIPVVERRPLLPLDVQAAFECCCGPGVWMTTPMHLRAIARTHQRISDCRLVLASTMPLTADLAAQVETLATTPVIEIFGSTETGAMATRRTANESLWRPLDGVKVEPTATAIRVRGEHFPSPQVIADRVELAADGRFELCGRQADVLKIGGRRTSIAGLNALVGTLPGLDDGVFYLPPGDAENARTAFIYQGSLDRSVAEHWMRERIDAVFLPRAWMQVERLPRDPNGKLSQQALDELWSARRQPDGVASHELKYGFMVPLDHPSIKGHFPNHPVVPGVLVLDKALEPLLKCSGRWVVQLKRVKFIAQLQPDQFAHVEIKIHERTARFRVTTEDGTNVQVIAEGTAVLAALDLEGGS